MLGILPGSDIGNTIIKALEELKQYRTIGTVEECRKAITVRREVQEIVDQQAYCWGRQLRRDICLLLGNSKSSSGELLDRRKTMGRLIDAGLFLDNLAEGLKA